MAFRGYTLLTTPLDEHSSYDEQVRIYDLVRRNIRSIAPFLPETAEIDLIAGGTPHNDGDIPLLGLFVPNDACGNIRIDLDLLQDAIDNWFDTQDPDRLDQSLMETDSLTWEQLVAVGTYPDRRST